MKTEISGGNEEMYMKMKIDEYRHLMVLVFAKRLLKCRYAHLCV